MSRARTIAGLRASAWVAMVAASGPLGGCSGGHNAGATMGAPAPIANILAVSVDSGPGASSGQINHAYVTVKVCVAGNQTQCANIDHVLLDTGSWGLRLVHSVIIARGIELDLERDSQGRTIEECLTFGGGQTWGPVALADLTIASEVAAATPIQILDDTASYTPSPAGCGTNGTLLNTVSSFGANGVLGIGVFAQDCGGACVNAATPLPVYFGCTAAGACSAENAALSVQVTNPVALFAQDNNGIIVNLPSLSNASGEAALQGEVIFGIATQADNMLPATGLSVLSTDANGDFTATYNGGTAVLPALIDSGTDSYSFDDPSIAVCNAGAFVGYYCPIASPRELYAVNTGAGKNGGISTVKFAIDNPNAFSSTASAVGNLAGGGGSTAFTWGMPYFYGRKIYLAIEGRAAGAQTGPYYAY